MYSKVIVCSGAKTGSCTLYNSVKEYFHGTDTRVIGAISLERHDYRVVDYEMSRASRDARILILTSFREPISRMVSSFFFFETFRDYDHARACMDDRLAEKDYFEAYHPVVQPPVFVSTFWLHRDECIDICYLRFDNIHKWEEQIGTFLPGFRIAPKNLSGTRPYYPLYRVFQETYRNKAFIDLMTHEKNVCIRYLTKGDVDEILRQWI